MVGIVGQNHKAKAISARHIAIKNIHCRCELKLLSKVCVQIECRIKGKEKAKTSAKVITILKCKEKTTLDKKK